MDLGSVDCEAKLYGKSMYYMPHLYAAREGGGGVPQCNVVGQFWRLLGVSTGAVSTLKMACRKDDGGRH